MKGFSKQIIATADGSHTVSIPGLGITYHSTRGAIQESMHVFLEAGLKPAMERFPDGTLHILEMGFGTGLNALLTALEAEHSGRAIRYTALEQYPLTPAEVQALNYPGTLGNDDLFRALHNAAWEAPVAVTPMFTLEKRWGSLLDLKLPADCHVVYFDAFAPDAQPELWTEAVFRKLYEALAPGGLLTTYCSKGVVRRCMAVAGFAVQKIPGPPGKREMVQAFRPLAVEGE